VKIFSGIFFTTSLIRSLLENHLRENLGDVQRENIICIQCLLHHSLFTTFISIKYKAMQNFRSESG